MLLNIAHSYGRTVQHTNRNAGKETEKIRETDNNQNGKKKKKTHSNIKFT